MKKIIFISLINILFNFFCSACDTRIFIWNPKPIYGGKGTFGHASIQVGSEYLSFHKGKVTTYEQDNASSADNIFCLNSAILRTDIMQKKIIELKNQAQSYQLLSMNCTYTVAQVLRSGGMSLGDIYNWGAIDAPTPYCLRDDLIKQFVSGSAFFLAVGCLGANEKLTLSELKCKAGFHLISERTKWQSHYVISKIPSINLFS